MSSETNQKCRLSRAFQGKHRKVSMAIHSNDNDSDSLFLTISFDGNGGYVTFTDKFRKAELARLAGGMVTAIIDITKEESDVRN
jgi:hypothetical protein